MQSNEGREVTILSLQVARLKLVQLLRPQALPVKLLGVGGHCFAANVPCGAVRVRHPITG